MAYTKSNIATRKFDVVIVGAGGSGMRASLQLSLAGLNVAVLAQVIFTRGPLDYVKWAGIYASQPMKMLTFATIAGLLYHVWVGMRDVLMDYVKPVGARLVLQILVIVWLVGCAGWAIQVLWRG